MTLRQRKLVWLVSACACVSALFAMSIMMVWGDLSLLERTVLSKVMTPRLGLLVTIAIMVLLGTALLARALFDRYVGLPARIVEEVRIRVCGPRTDHPLQPAGSLELAALIQSVNELVSQRHALQADIETHVREGKRSVEEEKNRLAALMSELGQSVVVCNLDGRILLYNNRARLQFRAMSDTPDAAGGGELIGLGRSIYNVLDHSLIAHALENMQHSLRQNSSSSVTHFVTATRAGQLLRVRMSPVLAVLAQGQHAHGEGQSASGFVLMLDNITREFEIEQRRDEILHTLTEGNRASLTNIRVAIETLDYPDLEPPMRQRFRSILNDEVEKMSHRLEQASNALTSALKLRWSQEEMQGADLVAAAQRRITSQLGLATKLEEIDSTLWMKVDSFSLLQVLTYLASRLADEFEVREVRFRLSAAEAFVHLDLIWSGQAMSNETVMHWELDNMQFDGAASLESVRDVIERHDGEMWLEREKTRHRAFFRILLPAVKPREDEKEEIRFEGESRPEYYDFDLFNWGAGSHTVEDRPLTELVYTVFDTETTGLDPSKGDEIIQIGATRVLNGKRLQNEFFEQLIDPSRPLSPESVKIHGITEDMLKGQPVIETVLPAFHAFALDTVLVAHNAAFDMRFLQLKQQATGLQFDQPVLDTLLLSAVIHPNQPSHRLEAIAERLGVVILGRHTAMGDAIVTAEVFLKLLPLLNEKGIYTLRQAREAAEKTYYARIQY